MGKRSDKFLLRLTEEYLKSHKAFQRGPPVSVSEIAEWAMREGRLPEPSREDLIKLCEREMLEAFLDKYVKEKGMPATIDDVVRWLNDEVGMLGVDPELLAELLKEKTDGETETWIVKSSTLN